MFPIGIGSHSQTHKRNLEWENSERQMEANSHLIARVEAQEKEEALHERLARLKAGYNFSKKDGRMKE